MDKADNWTSERRLFRRVTQTASLMFWATDASGLCFYLSPGWYSFTGTAEGAGLGYDWLTQVHPDDVALVRRTFFEANDARLAYGVAYRLLRADDQYCYVWDVGLPKIIENDVFMGFYGSTCRVESQSETEVAQGKLPVKNLLSPREREVVKLISEGNTSETVASLLGIGNRTVDSHLATAANKLGANNRTHTVAKAIWLNEI